MPATAPTVNRDTLANYPFAQGDTLSGLFLQGLPFWLTLPFTFSTADATALFTVPSGYRLFVHRTLWEIAADMTGGSSSTIGLSSDATGYTTKGDIQGGASGDAAAALTAGLRPGTIGAKFGSNGVIVIPAGKIIRFDRITSAFTAGNGTAQLQCSLLPTA